MKWAKKQLSNKATNILVAGEQSATILPSIFTVTKIPMNIQQILKKWGFNESEIAVYEVLLRKGSMNRTALAKELGMKTESLRHPLKLLLQKGLIGKVDINECPVYAAQHLKYLFQWVQHAVHERQTLDKNEIEAVRRFSEGFEFQADPILSKAEFFSGHAGLVRAYRKMLELCGEDGEIRSILSADERVAEHLQEYFVSEFVPTRVNKGIRNKVIAADSPKSRAYQSRDEEELRETKILSKDELTLNNSELNIFGEYVLTMSFNEENGYASIIYDKSTADVWGDIFEAMWNRPTAPEA